MNDFNKPAYTPTRIKRLEQEIETLQQARDRAIEAAAKNRLVAELALTALLPGFDVSRCDAADLEAIQDFLTATDHLKEMSDAEPLKLIRSLLESMDSVELQYINAAHLLAAFLDQLRREQIRCLALSEILKPCGHGQAAIRRSQLSAVNLQLSWALDGLPENSFSDYLQTSYSISQDFMEAEIDRQFRIRTGKEPATDDPKNQTSEMSPMPGPGESSGDPREPVPLQ